MLVFYSTDGCHLCEQAAQLLVQAGHAFETVDIIDDSALVDAYGVRIPVLKRPNGQELGWPFGLSELEEFIKDVD